VAGSPRLTGDPRDRLAGLDQPSAQPQRRARAAGNGLILLAQVRRQDS